MGFLKNCKLRLASQKRLERYIQDDSSILLYCCKNSLTSVVYKLLPLCDEEHLEYSDGMTRRTPLFYACINGMVDVAIRLINCGANINHTDYEGNTPLMISIINHSSGKNLMSVIETITYKNKHSLSDVNNIGDTPLICIVKNFHQMKGFLQYLTKHDIKDTCMVNHKNKEGDTALILCYKLYIKNKSEFDSGLYFLSFLSFIASIPCSDVSLTDKNGFSLFDLIITLPLAYHIFNDLVVCLYDLYIRHNKRDHIKYTDDQLIKIAVTTENYVLLNRLTNNNTIVSTAIKQQKEKERNQSRSD